MKNSNDINGNRTRDLQACCAVPRPSAPPRTAANDTAEGIIVCCYELRQILIEKGTSHINLQTFARFSLITSTIVLSG